MRKSRGSTSRPQAGNNSGSSPSNQKSKTCPGEASAKTDHQSSIVNQSAHPRLLPIQNPITCPGTAEGDDGFKISPFSSFLFIFPSAFQAPRPFHHPCLESILCGWNILSQLITGVSLRGSWLRPLAAIPFVQRFHCSWEIRNCPPPRKSQPPADCVSSEA